ncbi:hypothetical protein AAC387_Pa12g2001 [Persea americana]
MSHMDLNSNRIAWVGNIYQKLEAICQEVNGVKIQEKARYIESQVKTGCDSVLKFCAEFMEDLGEIVSETSLMYDVDFEKCVEAEVRSPIEEETLTPAELDEFVSLGKGPNSTTLSNGPYVDVNQAEACSVLINNSDSISEELTECDYPEKEEEIHNNHSDACSASSAYQCASERSNDLEWGEASLSTNVIGTSIEEEEESENVELENSLYLQAANAIGTSIEEEEESENVELENSLYLQAANVVATSIKEEEEFENVKLGNSLYLQAGNNEVCFTSFQERKKRSYKKMLQDVFTSKMRSAKKQDHRKLEIESLTVNVETKDSEEISMSSAPKVDLISSEWELL